MVSLVELIVDQKDDPTQKIWHAAKRISSELANSGINVSPKTALQYLRAYRDGKTYSQQRKEKLTERGFPGRRAYMAYLREQNKK